MEKEIYKLIDFIKIISTNLIESGDEINKVEEIVEKIIVSHKYKDANVFAISTGIFFSFKSKDNIYTDVIRIKKRGTNLKKIVFYTDVASDVINKKINIDKALKELNKFKDKPRTIYKIIFAGLSAGFFTLLYGGIYKEFIVSFICGMIIQYITMKFKRIDIFHFLNSLICSFITTTIAIVFIHLIGGTLDNIVIGSIMLILPGLTLTNSIKDILMGNLVTGTSRLSEAMFVAVAISIGVASSIIIMKVVY